MSRSYAFCPDAFKLKQITCDIIALCNDLENFEGKKLNGELVEFDRIMSLMESVKTSLIKKDEHL